MPKLPPARPPREAIEDYQVRKLAGSRHAPGDWIQRARMSVRSWAGLRPGAIAAELHCHPQTVRERLARFKAAGVDGLGDRPGPERTPRLSEAERSTLVALVGAGLVLELGWLTLWPVTYAFPFTHSWGFTRSYVLDHPDLWRWLSGVPGLSTTLPIDEPAFLPQMGAGSLLAIFGLAWAGYLGGLVVLDRGAAVPRGAGRLIVGFTLLFQATLLLTPGLFTTDVFSYLMYGRTAAVYGHNPYLSPPNSFPDDPLVPWIYGTWQALPSPYGPLWTDLSWGMARLTQPLGPTDQVLAQKLLISGIQLANVGLAWWLLGRLAPGDGARRVRLTALALFAWNPLVLFELAENGHNDGLVVLLLLLGLVPLARHLGRPASHRLPNPAWLTGLVLVGLSVLVKYASAVVGLFYAVAWARQLPRLGARVAWIGGAGLLVVGLALALLWPWLELPDILQPVFSNQVGARVQSTGTTRLASEVVGVLGGVLGPIGVHPAALAPLLEFGVKVLPRLLFVLYLPLEVLRVWTAAAVGPRAAIRALLRGAARASLLLLLLVVITQLHPWYFVLPLALVSLLGLRERLTQVSVAYTAVCMAAYPFDYLRGAQWTKWAMVSMYALPLLIPFVAWVLASRWVGRAGPVMPAPPRDRTTGKPA